MIHVKGPRLLILPRDPQPEVHEDGSPDLILTGATESGLITAALAVDRQLPVTMGKVLQVGSDPICPHCRKGLRCEVAVGDVVVFPPSAGEMIYFDGQRLLILEMSHVSAIVERKVAA